MRSMFCPECGGEYRPGFTVCADCNVALVASLDEAKAARAVADLEQLLTTHDPEELGEIVGLLEEEEIPYVVHAGTALPLEEEEGELRRGRPEPWEAVLFVHGPRFAEGEQLLAEVRAARPQPRG